MKLFFESCTWQIIQVYCLKAIICLIRLQIQHYLSFINTEVQHSQAW